MDETINAAERYSNAMLVKGIWAFIFGLFVLIWPIATLVLIMTILPIFVIVIGAVGLLKGIFLLGRSWNSISLIIVGALGVLLGIFILAYPGVSWITYMFLLAIWFVLHGIFEIFADSEQYPTSKGWLIFSGILSILVGIILFFNPVAAGITLFWILGIYGVITGPILIMTALGLKSGTSGTKNVPHHA